MRAVPFTTTIPPARTPAGSWVSSGSRLGCPGPLPSSSLSCPVSVSRVRRGTPQGRASGSRSPLRNTLADTQLKKCPLVITSRPSPPPEIHTLGSSCTFSRKINKLLKVLLGMTASVPGQRSGGCWGRVDLVSTANPGQGRGACALTGHSPGHCPPGGVRSQQGQGDEPVHPLKTTVPIPVTLEAPAQMVRLLPAHLASALGLCQGTAVCRA